MTCLVALLLASLARDQQEKPRRELADLSLEELMEIPVNEVVSATGFRQRIREAPASVTVVTAEQIRVYGYRTIADVLGGVRGAYTTNDRNYGYLGLRGFNIPGDYNNRLLTLVNGLRVNDSIYDGALFDAGFPVHLDDIERVEVVRGPASSLYGSNAFFGVVNVQTRKGRYLHGGQVSGAAGSFSTYDGHAAFGALAEDGPEIYLSGSGLLAGGQDHFYPEFDDPATGGGVSRNADRETVGRAFLQASWKGFFFQAAYAERFKEIPTAPFATNFPSRHTNTVDGLAFAELSYKHEFPGAFTAEAGAHLDAYWYDGEYEYGDPPFLQMDSSDGRRWGADLLLSRTFLDDRLKLSLGGEVRDDDPQNQETFDDAVPRVVLLDSREDASVRAVFAQADWSANDLLRVNVGVRFDDYDTFGDTVNPRAALIVAPDERTVVKLLYGRAFRAPTAYEVHYALPAEQKANPDLDAEIIHTCEIVLERSLATSLDLVASIFHFRVDDLITLTLDPADNLRVFRNQEEVSTTGVELELRGKLDNGVEGRASWSYQEARFGEGDSWLPNSPRNLATAAVSVPVAADGVVAALEARYVGERRTLMKDETDDRVTLNFTLTAREIAKGLDLSASVYNLLDEEYFDPGGVEHVQDQIEQDGLSFRLKLTWRF